MFFRVSLPTVTIEKRETGEDSSVHSRTDRSRVEATNSGDDGLSIGRRPLLRLLGVAAIPAGMQGVQATESDGYGENEFGTGGYGGSNEDGGGETDPVEPVSDPPRVDTFAIEEDSPPNPHANLHVEWAVSDADGDLERVTIDVYEVSQTTSPITSETVTVSGSSAADTQTFTIKRGSGSRYRVVLEARDSEHAVEKEREVQA